MTELVKSSTELSSDSAAVYAANLLRHYSFELGDDTIEQLLSHWLDNYPMNWVRLAAIEALYQGRYKAVSVEQILAFWQRRGQPLYHFNHEFERLVCEKFPRNLVPPVPAAQVDSTPEATSVLKPGIPYRNVVLQLPSLKATSKLRQPIESLPPAEPTSQDQPELTESTAELTESTSESPPEQAPIYRTYSYDLRDKSDSWQNGLSIELTHISTLEQHNLPNQGNADSAEVPAISADALPQELEPDTNGSDIWEQEAPATEPPSGLNSAVIHTIDWLTMNQSVETTADVINLQEPLAHSHEQAVKGDDPTLDQTETVIYPEPQVTQSPFNAEAIFPNLGAAIRSLQPKLRLQLATLYEPNWLLNPASSRSIHQFTPVAESPDFHSKLKSVAQPAERDSTDDFTDHP